jgi:hypothetical protein
VVPELWGVQVLPPVVVATIAPLLPAAKQVLALGQLTPHRGYGVPEFWIVQVLPPVVVARIVPAWPTAKQVLAPVQLIPNNPLPCGRGFSHSQRASPGLAGNLALDGA